MDSFFGVDEFVKVHNKGLCCYVACVVDAWSTQVDRGGYTWAALVAKGAAEALLGACLRCMKVEFGRALAAGTVIPEALAHTDRFRESISDPFMLLLCACSCHRLVPAAMLAVVLASAPVHAPVLTYFMRSRAHTLNH